MTISNGCKKMMAFVMAIALVLSVLFISAPKEAKANSGSPSVKVLGATLRLDDGDNNGKQAMRIGIQVNNANQAYACAVQLTVGAKTYTVATKAGYGDVVQEKLHSKDVPGNSVVYAVVLKNIPESAFYSTISILGKAWDIDDNLFTSDVAEKNVVGVVNTIQDKFPGLNICILNGSLYKNAGAAKLTADDLSGYSNDPDPEMTSNPLATPAPTREPAAPNTWEVPFDRFEETGEGQIFYSGGNDHDICAHVYDSYTGDLLCTNETGTQYVDGLVVNLPASEVAKNYRHVTVKYEYLSDSGRFGYKYRDTEGTEYFTFADFSRDGNTTEINIDAACVPVSKFFIITYDTGVSIRLKSIVFSNPVGLPTPTPTVAPSPTPVPTAIPNANFFAAQVPSGSSITVDGAVDAAWANAIEYPFSYYSNGRARNSSEATIKLLWDEDYIYGLYDVYDAFIDERNNDEWNRDGIEIFFDEDNSKESAYGGGSDPNTDAFQYRVSGLATDVTAPAKNGFSHNTSATSELYAGLTSNVKTASNGCGYRVEFAIPVVQKNNLGRVVGLDATVMDAYDGTRNNEMWFTSQKSGSMYSDASLFENVQLIATKPATPVNSPDPAQPADLLAHFTFDNSSRDGYVYRSTDGNAKATVVGSISSVSTDAMSGESLYKANGNPSYLRLQNADGSSMLDGKDNVTISYWSYVPDAYNNEAVNYGWAFYAGRHGIRLGDGNNRFYYGMIDRDGKYRYDTATSDGKGAKQDNIAKTSGAWNNVTVVISGTTSTVYVNGVQQATLSGMTLSEALGTDSDLFIGIRPWSGGYEYFQGYIDDFAVFGRAFTSTEVANYVGAVSVPTPAPTATPTPTPEPTPPVTDTELDPANLVTNGNFADGTTGWTRDNCTITAEVVDGTNCALVSGRGNNYAAIISDMTGPFLPGDVLTYQFKVKRTAAINKNFEVCLKYEGTGDDNIPASSNAAGGNLYGSTDSWMTVTGTFTVSKSASTIRAYFRENGWKDYNADGVNKSDYDFYIDDVQFVRTFAATPTPAAPTPVPVYTNETTLEDGQQYLLLFNNVANNQSTEQYYTNVGDLYALTNNTGSSNSKTISSSLFASDRSVANVLPSDYLAATWLCESYNNSTTEFTLKNASTGEYLDYGSGGRPVNLSSTKTSTCAWKLVNLSGEGREGYDFTALTPVSDTTKFVRISNGSSRFQYGSTSSGTDGRNAHVYIYKLNPYSAWDTSATAQAKYDAASLTTDVAGKEIIFTASEDNKTYALSIDAGNNIIKTDITDYVIGDSLYIPSSVDIDDLNKYSWDCYHNCAGDSGAGYGFQNMFSKQYLGIQNSALMFEGNPVHASTDGKRTHFSDALLNNESTSLGIRYVNGAFVAASSSNNIRIYAKSYSDNYAKKSTWRLVDHFTSNRDYLIVSSDAAGSAKAFRRTSNAGSTAIGTSDVTIIDNGDGMIINYDGVYNANNVWHSMGLSEGSFELFNYYSNPGSRQSFVIKHDGTLYISSDHVAKDGNDYHFRFRYENGVLFALRRAAGTETLAVKYNGSAFASGAVDSGTGDVFLFEREQ